MWEQTVAGLRDSQKKLQQELAEAKEKAAQADASKWAVEQRLTSSLAQIEKQTDELKSLKDRLEAVEAEARTSALDRQRFVMYLEEGLAMLGAIPPSTESQPVIKIPDGLPKAPDDAS